MADPELTEYAARLRAWLDDNAGAAPERSTLAPQDEQAVRERLGWQRQLADAGYLGVTWPEQYGGAGGVPAQRILVERELDARGIPGGLDFVGLDMVGPTILACGSDRQKQRFLRPLLRGEEVWCQLLSEPGAGSDLASVATRARQQDDGHWVVDGQKVWTSFARHAAFDHARPQRHRGREAQGADDVRGADGLARPEDRAAAPDHRRC